MRDYVQIPAELLDTIKCWLTVAIQTGIEPFNVSGIETPNRKYLKDCVERISALQMSKPATVKQSFTVGCGK